MKGSLLNLINVASVLSSLSAPLSPSSWGLCVCVCVGGVGGSIFLMNVIFIYNL